MQLPDLNQLSLAQQVAQMVVVRTTGFLFDHQLQYPQWEADRVTLHRLVAEVGVGGIIFLGGSAAELALKIQELQHWAPIPLLTCADVEEGVGQRFTGATWFPPPMALAGVAQRDRQQAEHLAEAMGRSTAREAWAIGLNWILTPTVDVNNNPANPVINVRAFGEDAAIVSRLTEAFIRGTQDYPVLNCAKHFPGHGDTAIDSHWDVPLIPHGWERLEQVEFPPFRTAIAAGVDAIMSAHLRVPALDADQVTTFSRSVMTALLREQWGFAGLVVTDALVMGAIADRYGNDEAAVLAVEAGCDLLMMPVDAEGAIAAVCQAVAAGRIPAEQIRASLGRIWQAKERVCLSSQDRSEEASTNRSGHRSEDRSMARSTDRFIGETTDRSEARSIDRTLDFQARLLTELAQPETMATVQQILQASMQVQVPNSSRLVPTAGQSPQDSPLRNLILVDESLGSPFLGRTAPAIVLPQAKGYHSVIVDRNTPDVAAWAVQPTLLQVFLRGNPLRSQAAALEQVKAIVQALAIESAQLQAIVVYGSPYVAQALFALVPPEVATVFTYGQLPLAQTLALDTLFATIDRSLDASDKEGMF
ncbi:glycoside hydrolase family 3 N-terminal domain-containing protein [Alkalinema sp. FACHB-956]|uniref:glycoside hydrolase family 3 N-terminal domain-containing protein n=1 Tax=Alkalinema sp. FACHB-956 TaxID=2692768 RepID=UPI001685F3CE|nr:glycoside hydrolase family 3 N-terminal domain-containing protein [Alkalinema sp. FACHB-956]MBD2325266.1 beta-glucosidase [Alkalinema sp. FACHB-956]